MGRKVRKVRQRKGKGLGGAGKHPLSSVPDERVEDSRTGGLRGEGTQQEKSGGREIRRNETKEGGDLVDEMGGRLHSKTSTFYGVMLSRKNSE